MLRTALVALVGLAIGCTPTGRKTACENESPVAHGPGSKPGGPQVVMTLQTRDHEVTVYGGGEDLLFTISLYGSGAVLAERVDESEFANAFPGIHQHFRDAFADEAGGLQAPIWAGL